MSPYRKETWIKKGYTEEEAIYQIKIRRPTNEEYWMHKFNISWEEAHIRKLEHQSIGGKKAASRSKEEIRKTSVRCKEYWLNKGLTEEEAKQEVSNVQRVFSKEICIEKHGEEEGLRIWQDRQDRWQATLNSKSDEEKDYINGKKNTKKISNWIQKYGKEEGIVKFKEFINRICRYPIPETIDEIKEFILNRINEDPFLLYRSYTSLKKEIPEYFWSLVKKPKSIENWLEEFIILKIPESEVIFHKRNKKYDTGLYQMYTKNNTLLKSSNEILFYQYLKENDFEENIDFKINKHYPNSRFIYDFYMIRDNEYIELCGGDKKETEYYNHMIYKQQTFNSVLLWNKKDYKGYIEDYVRNNNRSTNRISTLESFFNQ